MESSICLIAVAECDDSIIDGATYFQQLISLSLQDGESGNES